MNYQQAMSAWEKQVTKRAGGRKVDPAVLYRLCVFFAGQINQLTSELYELRNDRDRYKARLEAMITDLTE